MNISLQVTFRDHYWSLEIEIMIELGYDVSEEL